MKGALGGYTVVEVMIVLAISAVMLLSAITAFSGKKQDTYFSQAVYDLQSQIQSIANDVSSQSVPGLPSYKCQATNLRGKMRPTLFTGAGSSQDCIYMGQAIQVAPDATTLYSYPVMGLKSIYSGAQDTGTSSPSAVQAVPEPAMDTSGNVITSLRTDYGLLNGLKVVSATYNGGAESDIIAMLSNLKSNNTSGNEIDVTAMNITGNSTPDSQVLNCLEDTPSSCFSGGTAVTDAYWNLCVASGSKQARIDVRGTPTGIATKLNMLGCS